MSNTYIKKNIYQKNNFYKEPKKNNIIYPNLKINPLSKDFLNFLKKKEFSNNFIYARSLNKFKSKKLFPNKYQIYPKKLSLKKSNSNSNINNIKQSINIQKQNIEKNNKNNIEPQNSQILKNDEIKYINFSSNKTIITKENNIIIENNKDNKKEKEKENGEDDNNLEKSIKKLWEDLCVPESYQELFNAILNQIEDNDKNKLIENEFNELNELKNDIDTLLCVIKMRIEILNELKEMNNKLRLIFKSDTEESNSILVKNMSNKIEKLRNYTISICFYMKKIKNKIYDGSRKGKFDIDIISDKFKFDKNYLIKMKEEMNFLKDGYAKYFFNITEDHTPFLVKASEEDPNANGDPFIHLIPMSKEIKEKIEKCNYIIYQELISYQNKDFKENKFRPISPIVDFKKNIKPKQKILSAFKRYNNNLLLKPIKSSYKRENFVNEINNKFPKIPKINHRNSFLKENSCINFEIKNLKFENKSILKLNNNNINNIINDKNIKIKDDENKFVICNNINTTIGDKKRNIDNDYYKNYSSISSNTINNKIILSSLLDFSHKKFEVIFYNKSINKFNDKYYMDYYKKISQQEINMFQIQKNLLNSVIYGISPCLMLIKENHFENINIRNNIEDKIIKNTIYGICSLTYINSKNKISIKITHISTIINFDSSDYINNLKKLYEIIINYIFEEFYFDEIFIEYNKEKANQEILDIFINYLNFNVESINKVDDKKINLNSEENGGEAMNYNIEKNILIYRKNKKTNEKINRAFLSFTGKNLFNIFNSLIMVDTSYLNSKDDNFLRQKQNDIFNSLYINIEAVDYLLKLDEKTNINSVFNKVSSLDQLMKIFFQNNISTEEIPLSAAENRYNILSCLLNSNINSNFNNSHFFNNYNIYNSTSYLDKKTGIYYNFIKPEKIYVMFSEKFEANFYHIIYNNIALFFAQINENQKNNYFGNNNIYAQIEDIYKDLLTKQIIGELNNILIWIPCFHIYRHFKYLTNNNNFTFHEYLKVSNNIIFSKTKEQLKPTNIIFKNKISSFQIEPELDKDIIFDSDFIFGIISNGDIFKTICEKANSIKISNNSEEKYYESSDIDKMNFEQYTIRRKDNSSLRNIDIKQFNIEINKDDIPYVVFLNHVKESDFKKSK